MYWWLVITNIFLLLLKKALPMEIWQLVAQQTYWLKSYPPYNYISLSHVTQRPDISLRNVPAFLVSLEVTQGYTFLCFVVFFLSQVMTWLYLRKMTVLLPLADMAIRTGSFHSPISVCSSISVPQGVSTSLYTYVYIHNIRHFTHVYKAIAHIHINTEPKGYYFK